MKTTNTGRTMLLALAATVLCTLPASATILTFEGAGLSSGQPVYQDYGDNVTAPLMGSFGYEIGNDWTPYVAVEYTGTTNYYAGTHGVISYHNVPAAMAAGTWARGIINLVPEAPWLAVRINSFELLTGSAPTQECDFRYIWIDNGDGDRIWTEPNWSLAGVKLTRETVSPDITGAAGETLKLGFSSADGRGYMTFVNFDQIIVPEPGSLALLALGGLCLLRRRR